MSSRSITAALAAGLLASVTGSALADTVVTFDDGLEGWVPYDGSAIEATGGNPGANLHTVFNDFGVNYDTTSNTEFVTDYTQFESVTISVDLMIHSIGFLGLPTARPWVLELRDYDNPPAGYPYVSVYYEFGWFDHTDDWTNFSVTIADTNSKKLPAGWGGTGAESQFGEPFLPADRTFASVLAGIDEVAYTTLLPGYFFTASEFDLRLDNISIETVEGTSCTGDIDGDGGIGFQDLVTLLSVWGDCPGGEPCAADLNGDLVVGFEDLLLLLSLWGDCP